MESFAVTLIFILGGLTFLVNWAFLILKGTEVNQEESLVAKSTKLLVYFSVKFVGRSCRRSAFRVRFHVCARLTPVKLEKVQQVSFCNLTVALYHLKAERNQNPFLLL